MKIAPLYDHLEFLDEMAELHHAEWQHISSTGSIEKRKKALTNAANSEGIPSIYVAYKETEFIGSAAIVAQDLETRPDIGPWLAAVFVRKSWRKKGVATQLCKHIEIQAIKASVQKLYLVTENASKFYAKNNWLHLEQCEYKGIVVDVMYKKLDF